MPMNESQTPSIKTKRLLLRNWYEADRASFAEMNQHPEVMKDLGGPINRFESDRKFDRYVALFEQCGFSRWVVEVGGEFVGYCGVIHRPDEHPLGPHDEIGWRLIRRAWGQGYATEAAIAALDDIYHRVGLQKVVSYTSADNHRSQAVMRRIGLRREPTLDFSFSYTPETNWDGLVWVGQPK